MKKNSPASKDAHCSEDPTIFRRTLRKAPVVFRVLIKILEYAGVLLRVLNGIKDLIS